MNLIQLLEKYQDTLLEATVTYNRWCGSATGGSWAQARFIWARGKGWDVPLVLIRPIYSNARIDRVPYYGEVKYSRYEQGRLEVIVEEGCKDAAKASPQA